VNRSAGIQAAGEGDADSFTDRQRLQDGGTHACILPGLTCA
jgi:hypothetical protein